MDDTIKKPELNEMVLFTMNHIPQADKATLEKFIELVNTTETFGAISYDQILNKMALILNRMPGACPQSLMILAELLEIPQHGEPSPSRVGLV